MRGDNESGWAASKGRNTVEVAGIKRTPLMEGVGYLHRRRRAPIITCRSYSP